MKNLQEVLRQKELELQRLEKEVEALRIAAQLLSEEEETTEATNVARVAAASAGGTLPKAAGEVYSAAWGNPPTQFP
jgi:hypothetical protein